MCMTTICLRRVFGGGSSQPLVAGVREPQALCPVLTLRTLVYRTPLLRRASVCLPPHLQPTLAGLTSVPFLAAITGSANTFTLQPGVCLGKALSLSGELKTSGAGFHVGLFIVLDTIFLIFIEFSAFLFKFRV